MHKRKYTREQLEFYFKKLMNDIKKVPREEDLEIYEGYPSVKAYVDRFGSWKKTVELFANFDLAKRQCLNCKKILIKDKKTRKFCSKACAQEYYQKKTSRTLRNADDKIKQHLSHKCAICGFDTIVEIHVIDGKESRTRFAHAVKNNNFTNIILLCPNHHQMVHKKLATLIIDGNHVRLT